MTDINQPGTAFRQSHDEIMHLPAWLAYELRDYCYDLAREWEWKRTSASTSHNAEIGQLRDIMNQLETWLDSYEHGFDGP